jgi:hypothetical protein
VNESQARDAVNGAALVVAGIYFYRKLIEPAAGATPGGAGVAPAKGSTAQPTSIKGAGAQLLGFGPLASTGRFVVGFGFVFIVLSLAEGASPELAGYFALLIALGSILGNGIAVATDLTKQLHLEPSVPGTVGEANPAPTVRVAAWEPGEVMPSPAPSVRRGPKAPKKKSHKLTPTPTIA